jgi:SAM-dependent methyltransferase
MARKKKITQFETYWESLEYLRSIAQKTNEYYLRRNIVPNVKERISNRAINTFHSEDLVLEEKQVGNGWRSIIKAQAIERFHPNNIDNKDFWVASRTLFPLLSVCGGECKSIVGVNKLTLDMSKDFGMFQFLNELIETNKSDEPLNVLEIGCGYGNVFHEIKHKCTYHGIDYIIDKSLKKYKNFIEIDKSGIPDFFIGADLLDVVYCVNVFQHCSQQDRFDYIKQAYASLKNGGHMIFTMFMMTERNKNEPYWGIVDTQGRGYTQFFNQLTECDWDYEIIELLEKTLDFKLVKGVTMFQNFAAFIVKKVV